MEWTDVKNKPSESILAVVCNDKGWMGYHKAVYYPDKDVWLLDENSTCNLIFLDVTHYIEIPPPPVKEQE